MLIDLHIHTKEYSQCSKVSFEEIIQAAKEKGLDGICITDHDSFGAKELIEHHKYSDLLIILGIEVLTKQGDILVFGAYDLPQEIVEVSDLVSLVEQQGGITIAAHPYRNNNRGIGDHISNLAELNAVEVLNGNTAKDNNYRALLTAKENKKVLIAASDAHTATQVGIYATKFHESISNVTDLVSAIKHNQVTPMIYNQFEKRYDKMEEAN